MTASAVAASKKGGGGEFDGERCVGHHTLERAPRSQALVDLYTDAVKIKAAHERRAALLTSTAKRAAGHVEAAKQNAMEQIFLSFGAEKVGAASPLAILSSFSEANSGSKSPFIVLSSGLSSLNPVLQAHLSNIGFNINSSGVVGLSQSFNSIFFSSLYQSLTKLQQSVTPQTHGLPNKGGLYPHGS